MPIVNTNSIGLAFVLMCIQIQSLVAAVVSPSALSKLPVSKVPFLWGTATAAYQIEGAIAEDGKGPSIWDTFSAIPNKVHNNDTGVLGTDSYHQYKKDIAIMKEMGVTAHRFSIAWPRIIPDGNGEINYAGIHHYNLFIDELLKNGIEPMVTLYHWDLPESLEKKYKGWLNKQIVKDFARYTDVCFQAFGDRVKYWMTINEPWTFSYFGYAAGTFAPGRCSDRSKCPEGDSKTECYLVAHNVILAHGAAVKVYRNKYASKQQGQIGMVLNHDWAEPLTDSPLDKAAAERKNIFAMGWFGDPIVFGAYPTLMVDMLGDRLPKFTKEESAMIKGSFDFWGLNHYSSKYVSHPIPDKIHTEFEGGWDVDMNIVASTVSKDGIAIGAQSDSSWLQVVPWGFYKVIKWSNDRYSTAYNAIAAANNKVYKNKNFKFIITENGCDVPEESDLPLQMALQDDFRINYYAGYIREMERAMSEGVDIRGYMAWSLLDNFEWADGYNFRFGMIYVDFNSDERTRYPKASSRWYADYARSHANYIVNYDAKTIQAYSIQDENIMEQEWQEELENEMEKEEEKEEEKEKEKEKEEEEVANKNYNKNNKKNGGSGGNGKGSSGDYTSNTKYTDNNDVINNKEKEDADFDDDDNNEVNKSGDGKNGTGRDDDDEDDDHHHNKHDGTKTSSSSSLSSSAEHSYFRDNGDLNIEAFYTTTSSNNNNSKNNAAEVDNVEVILQSVSPFAQLTSTMTADTQQGSANTDNTGNNMVDMNKYKKPTYFNYYFSWLSNEWMQSWQLAQLAPFRQQPQYFI